jgi:4-hydroxy-2-oxoheptanedioate aldolase
MRSPVLPAAAACLLLTGLTLAQTGGPRRLNAVIALLEQQKPIFGLYAPSAGGGRRAAQAPPKQPIDLAREALAYPSADFLFDGGMERGLDRGLPSFAAFVSALGEASAAKRPSHLGLTRPLVVKTPKISTDAGAAVRNIGRQLEAGASGIVFVDVESAEEARQGLAAMRFTAHGGTRADDVGAAPAFWGMNEAEYRRKADLWPLNPDGELVNWTIVESKEGLARVREIAAVKGIGVLFPGAGTLRRVFTTTSADGQRTFDATGWEAAIQQVLAACREFKVACGYPATADDIEMRMRQGFSVFIMNWGEGGFKAIDVGRRAAGRTDTR